MVVNYMGNRVCCVYIFERLVYLGGQVIRIFFKCIKEVVVFGLDVCLLIFILVLCLLWSVLVEYNGDCGYYCFGYEREKEGILKYVLVW